MLAWMIYAVAAGAAAAAAAHLAERGLLWLRRPVRWVWFAAMVATVLWPFAAARLLEDPGISGSAGSATAADPLRVSASGLRGAAADVSAAVAERWLVSGWLILSIALLLLLLLAADALRRDRRWWRPGVVAGERVLLSAAVGPAVVGALRPRIVLPTWVLDLDESVQWLIVHHEREHVRAGDSRVLAAGLLLLLLLPWCLPLWWQFYRMRFAIEADCDSRLLRDGAEPRAYAEALLTVARWRPSLLPLATMAPSTATLRRRIRYIAARKAPVGARRALIPLSGAAVLLLAASALPAPHPPSPGSLLLTRAAPMAPESVEPHPDGSLPGDPGEDRLQAAIAAHHAAAIAGGIAPGSIVWFIAGADGTVRRTGIERGSEAEVAARIRARYPAETSDFMLGFAGVPADGTEVDVLWMLPPP